MDLGPDALQQSSRLTFQIINELKTIWKCHQQMSSNPLDTNVVVIEGIHDLYEVLATA